MVIRAEQVTVTVESERIVGAPGGVSFPGCRVYG